MPTVDVWTPDLDEYGDATLRTGGPIGGSTSFWGSADDLVDDGNYSQGNICPICGAPIKNRADYCRRHAAMLRKLQPKIDRLCEMAAQQRRVDEIARSIVPRMARVGD